MAQGGPNASKYRVGPKQTYSYDYTKPRAYFCIINSLMNYDCPNCKPTFA